jgi:hypothetical protein
VPLYDGAQFPDEPYRYVAPPPGAKATAAPTVAKAPVLVKNGVNGAQFVNSGEQGPQISLYVPATSLKAPAGATTITVTATPMAPSAPLPSDGTIVTNVYRVTASNPQGPVTVVGNQDSTTPALQMRAPSAKQPGPVFEQRDATGWQQLKTVRIGVDIYQAFAPRLGDFALVQLTNATSSTGTGGSGGVNLGLVFAGIGVLVLAGVIVVIRTARSRSGGG